MCLAGSKHRTIYLPGGLAGLKIGQERRSCSASMMRAVQQSNGYTNETLPPCRINSKPEAKEFEDHGNSTPDTADLHPKLRIDRPLVFRLRAFSFPSIV